MKNIIKTRTLWGSIIVTIPKTIVEYEDIKVGEVVKLIVKKDGFGLFKGVGRFTPEDELK